MIRRGGSGLLAASVVGVAWLVGSTALAILGIGLCLAFVVARVWLALVTRGLSVERRPLAAAAIEGEAPFPGAATCSGQAGWSWTTRSA